jgi:hypothetical protein
VAMMLELMRTRRRGIEVGHKAYQIVPYRSFQSDQVQVNRQNVVTVPRLHVRTVDGARCTRKTCPQRATVHSYLDRMNKQCTSSLFSGGAQRVARIAS